MTKIELLHTQNKLFMWRLTPNIISNFVVKILLELIGTKLGKLD